MQDHDHPYFELDTHNPLHAKAYLLAASHFLCGWPQDWSAERLAMALVDEESEDQKKVVLWDAAKGYAASIDSDPYLATDSLACDLAENIIKFAQEHAQECCDNVLKLAKEGDPARSFQKLPYA
jgi:hypothetical protein